MPSSAQSVSTIFDDETAGATYRNASWGSYQGTGEYLQLAGTGKDKLPITTSHFFSGIHSGIISWKHASGGAWELYIANTGWSAKDFSKYDSLIFYLNGPDTMTASEMPLIGLESANFNSKSSVIPLSSYIKLDQDSSTWQRVSIPLTAFQPYVNFTLTQFKSVRFLNNGVTAGLRTLWIDKLAATSISTNPKALPPMTDDQLLDTLQYTAFQFFWKEANAANGMIKDRSTSGSAASIASVGFGMTAIGVGIDRGWISRDAGRTRVYNTVKTFWNGAQGAAASGIIGYKGWFYHFLDMNTATRAGTNELSSIDTGLLLAGLIYAREYFDGSDTTEVRIRSLVDSIYARIDWTWMMGGGFSLTMGWSPEGGMLSARWVGYNEAMILYILGLGTTANPLPIPAWNAWTAGYQWANYGGINYVPFAPLFGHQYSHCWVDFRDIRDTYMQGKGIDYFENSKRATLANRAYCITNQYGFAGYSDSLWGLTACDGPNGYKARGGPWGYDDGTIAPTAAVSSIPFTPKESMQAIRGMVNMFGTDLFGKYGFRDAFSIKDEWIGSDYIGIDEGPIIIMIENYRTGKVWQTFMKNSSVQNGLKRAGFIPVSSTRSTESPIASDFALEQNFPNPFNPSTTIRYTLPYSAPVTLTIFDAIGRAIATPVDETQKAGVHEVMVSAERLSSGLYFYQLSFGSHHQVKSMVVLK